MIASLDHHIVEGYVDFLEKRNLFVALVFTVEVTAYFIELGITTPDSQHSISQPFEI